jgi:hypothetical protein
VPGTYVLDIRATGREKERIFLNSEQDYRDPRNLTVEILPAAMPALKKLYGQDPDAYFMGRRVAVTGEAQRVTVWFTVNGKQTEKYYYQTHVVISDASQIKPTS